MENLKDKVIWITGASSGFGKALAIALADKGAKIILSARNIDTLNQVKAKIPDSKVIPLDLEDSGNFQKKTQEAIQAFGYIDMVIHNAGIAQNSKATETKPEVEQKIMQINYKGPIQLTQSLLPHFKKRKNGTIVVVSGLLAYFNLPGRSTYAAAKAALISYFGCLRAEVLPFNINISVLIPGNLQTELINKALTYDGSVISIKREVKGYPLDKAANQAIKIIQKKKFQSYIGEKKQFYMLKLWGLFPNYVIRLLLKMSS